MIHGYLKTREREEKKKEENQKPQLSPLIDTTFSLTYPFSIFFLRGCGFGVCT